MCSSLPRNGRRVLARSTPRWRSEVPANGGGAAGANGDAARKCCTDQRPARRESRNPFF